MAGFIPASHVLSSLKRKTAPRVIAIARKVGGDFATPSIPGCIDAVRNERRGSSGAYFATPPGN
jgi:hypothetical protein